MYQPFPSKKNLSERHKERQRKRESGTHVHTETENIYIHQYKQIYLPHWSLPLKKSFLET